MLATAVGNSKLNCATNEYLQSPPLTGQTCAEDMSSYFSSYGGYLSNLASAGKLRALLRYQYVAGMYRHESVQLMAQFRLMRIYIIFNIRNGSLSILARPSAQGLGLV